MIEQSLNLLKEYFVRGDGVNSGGSRHRLEAPLVGSATDDDLCPIEVFFSSTRASSAVSGGESGGTQHQSTAGNFRYAKTNDNSFLKSLEKEATERRRMKDIAEREAIKRRQYLKHLIDTSIATDVETHPLGRFLHNSIREDLTLEKIKDAREDEQFNASRKVFYVSPSFFTDVIYESWDGVHKRKIVMDLLEQPGVIEPVSDERKPLWSMNDTFKNIVPTIFKQPNIQYMYENNLQNMLLHCSSRLNNETQRVNPRGSIVAYMCLYAPRDDPLVEIVPPKEAGEEYESPPKRQKTGPGMMTTVRGLLCNVLDGTLYKNHSIVNLQNPYTLSGSGESDLEIFCNKVLLYSFYAIFLTYVGVKVCQPNRLPEDRFLVNDKGTKTIKLLRKEVVFDRRTGTWFFLHDGCMKRTGSFWALISYLL